MLTLFVGDCTEHTADHAKAHDPSAFLADRSNWREVVIQSQEPVSLTAYTSLADLPKIDAKQNPLWDLMQAADEIHYRPPAVWSDQKKEFTWTRQKETVELYLTQLQHAGKRVIGIEQIVQTPNHYLHLTDSRRSLDPSIWIVGCSVSHGVGVGIEEKYGSLVARHLHRPTYHLTSPGTSLEWQCDQLLRSDIQQQDLVIWGLTRENRAPQAINGKVDVWPDDTIQDVDFRLHETRYYKALVSVYQVINFCQKIGCELVLLPLLCSEKLYMAIMSQKSFCHVPYRAKYIDLATDGVHPGPQQHAEYAQVCVDFLQTKGYQ